MVVDLTKEQKMKNLIILLAVTLMSQMSYAQFQFDKTYQSTSEDGSHKYIKIYDDGFVIMVNTKDSYEQVKEYFSRDSKDSEYIILYRSQSKIKDAKKASFVIENDGTKINCIAQGADKTITLVMLSPSAGKMQTEFTLVEE